MIPLIKAKRFEQQAKARQAGDVEAHFFDTDNIEALEYGCRQQVPVAHWIDLLVM